MASASLLTTPMPPPPQSSLFPHQCTLSGQSIPSPLPPQLQKSPSKCINRAPAHKAARPHDSLAGYNKVRSTIDMDKSDPNVVAAVAELREASNLWVAKYRRDKALLGRPSFRDMYSALNAVSAPPRPYTVEKALLLGR